MNNIERNISPSEMSDESADGIRENAASDTGEFAPWDE